MKCGSLSKGREMLGLLSHSWIVGWLVKLWDLIAMVRNNTHAGCRKWHKNGVNLLFFLGSSYPIYPLDYALYGPLYPLDIDCSSRSASFSLDECSHVYIYSASAAQVGIDCGSQDGSLIGIDIMYQWLQNVWNKSFSLLAIATIIHHSGCIHYIAVSIQDCWNWILEWTTGMEYWDALWPEI